MTEWREAHPGIRRPTFPSLQNTLIWQWIYLLETRIRVAMHFKLWWKSYSVYMQHQYKGLFLCRSLLILMSKDRVHIHFHRNWITLNSQQIYSCILLLFYGLITILNSVWHDFFTFWHVQMNDIATLSCQNFQYLASSAIWTPGQYGSIPPVASIKTLDIIFHYSFSHSLYPTKSQVL